MLTTAEARFKRPYAAYPPSPPSRGVATAPDPRRNGLLGALPEPVLQRWLPELEPVELPLGMVLREPGRPQKMAIFPTTGIVGLMVGLEDGRSGAVALIGREGLAGVSTFLGGDAGTGLSRKVVLVAGRGYRMRSSVLLAEFERGGPATERLLRYTQALITQLGQVVVCNRHHSIVSRLCTLLLSIMDRLDGGPLFAMTHEAMAGALGVRREGITEAALQLQRRGLLDYHRGHLQLLDPAGLAHHSCECYAVVKQEYARLLPAPGPLRSAQ